MDLAGPGPEEVHGILSGLIEIVKQKEANMSGKNVIQKILARASGRESVETGEYLMVKSNCPTPCQGDSLGRGNDQIEKMGAKLFDPKRVRICVGKSLDAPGEGRRKFHQWAERMGVPKENFVELGQHGVPHIICGEHAWARPGELYFSMTNGATASLGALGGFAVTLSTETGSYLAMGTTWIQVPEVARFTLTGKTQPGVFARDVFEYTLGKVGDIGETGRVILYDGDYVSNLGMNGRFTLCAQAICASAWTAIIEPDKVTLKYVKSRTNERVLPLNGDPDAEYAEHLTFDVSNIDPQVAPPPRRASGTSISQLAGKVITRAGIGSCANGRMDDMRVAASILKGREVHPDVTLSICPGSMDIYLQALKEGLIETFIKARVLLLTPSCAGCGGGYTLASDDVFIGTGTVNHPGRMGSDTAQIFLASPATVAASAVEGRITDPRKFIMR